MDQIIKLENFNFENELASLRYNDGDFYEVKGTLTEEDFEEINGMHRKTILILKDIKGISSEFLTKITNENIYFSIIGGLDYLNKNKYKEQEYYNRTLVSKLGLVEIIKYYEGIEKYINPSWNELEKAMYVYSSVCEDFTYNEKYDTYLSAGTMERSLNGILQKKLVCAGFGQVYKVAMERLGIDCIYQNKRHSHVFNVLEIEGHYYGVDLTWDCYNKNKENDCDFKNFGNEDTKTFYNRDSHDISSDPEETLYNLEVISPKLRQQALDNINEARLERKKEIALESISFRDNIKYYPLDEKENYSEEVCKLAVMHKILMILEQNNKISHNEFLELSKGTHRFFTIASDLVPYKKFGGKYSRQGLLGTEIGLSEKYSFDFDNKIDTPNGKNYSEMMPLSNEDLQSTLSILEQKYDHLKFEYLNSIFFESKNIINELSKINNFASKDQNIMIEQSLLESKMEFLTYNKTDLMSQGIEESKIDEVIEKYSNYKNIAYPKEDFSSHEHATKLEVLEVALLGFEEMKSTCENHDGKKYSDEEWRDLYLDLTYLKSVFDFSQFQDITETEIERILYKNVQIYDEKIRQKLTKDRNIIQNISNDNEVSESLLANATFFDEEPVDLSTLNDFEEDTKIQFK